MNRLALIISFVALTAATARAQELSTLNPDLRTTAMGGASVAVSDGKFAVWNNAASVLFDYRRAQAGFSYTPWQNGNYYSAGGYYSFDEKNTLSAGVRFSNYSRSGSTPLDATAELAYSRLVHDYVGVGVTAHYIHGSYGNGTQYNALGFDLSVYSQIPTDKMAEDSWVAVGAKIADIGVTFGGNDNVLPSRASVGTAVYLPIGESHELLGTVEAEYRFAPKGYHSLGAGIGAEYTLMQFISLRAGYHVADRNGLNYGTVGAGIKFLMLKVDFSYMLAAKGSPLRNRYGIGVGFNF